MNVDIAKCCIESAAELKPCLCDSSSTEDAFIDVYIQNKTKTDFFLCSSQTKSNAGRGFVDVPGIWIVKPPEYIGSGKTVFFRAYSGKFSTTDNEQCFFPVQFVVHFRYVSPDQPGVIIGNIVKLRDGVGSCTDLNPFSPVEQRNIYEGEINAYQNTLLARAELPVDIKWTNTAFIIVSGVTDCKIRKLD